MTLSCCSRRKRKRDRQTAEATANNPPFAGGQGGSCPKSLADYVLVRRAINEGWPIPSLMKTALVNEIERELDSGNVRRILSAARTALAMEASNIRTERQTMCVDASNDWPTDVPKAERVSG